MEYAFAIIAAMLLASWLTKPTQQKERPYVLTAPHENYTRCTNPACRMRYADAPERWARIDPGPHFDVPGYPDGLCLDCRNERSKYTI